MEITVPCFAKLNLDLRVLYKRSDGYHELRTIFQTVSLKDTLAIEWNSAKRTQIELDSSVDIPDNLVVRSAAAVLDHLKATGWVRFSLRKTIPMGAGLGGGSSNAAAVLIALPALMRKKLAHSDAVRLAEMLGSDVAFFLHGGTALGLGRGTELYPLPDQPARPAVIVSSGIHVSTAEAYRALNRGLTSTENSPILSEFQTIAWDLSGADLGQLPLKNDFENAVFDDHPQLGGFVRKLRRLGARPARMTGSGSAVFGIFAAPEQAKSAAAAFPEQKAFPVRFVTRERYRRAWRRALGPVADASCFGAGPAV
ncbi:MAG: 4-(cytidine 5'-diphospho)-2-C-methyl-D-erythritol kinase [Acidobacteriaceae bacterium]|nr:4-(cytidine 5'-diphospho)-2-C-methyl-D-erythritol kinase [Acidobacteriaceae bacterium]